ncbi:MULTISPECIES: hypothetical protein [Cyanophyceae]|uniref:Uncharacterized protein n=1 Tax=Nodularia spumigena CENA596 TaxID=1819295 RepID=A0A161XN26_NODSP|nr:MULTISPECIES: hypothetical protein [Cyanophyceae]MDB9358157.1 hypothetical protein [Nodularia spumigena CS-587/03]KZL50174.1 hypothetical protein A2T98_08865 [Nodularia spumigena CENA596]MDB9305294.1 hypothetical protein [Nodularia spumigena CS-591/12]MDB9317206.1 hypothetical protein [Nodularia spumigena CS-590/01A]MDB9322035.1 hypothetical protein [Nodularia spumigena CS-591/07A]
MPPFYTIQKFPFIIEGIQELSKNTFAVIINKERKRELELYKLYASDPDFKTAFDDTIMQLLAQINLGNLQKFAG